MVSNLHPNIVTLDSLIYRWVDESV